VILPTQPKRIQRKRTKGWRMPEGAVYVGRPTMWGNPFRPGPILIFGGNAHGQMSVEECVKAYRNHLKIWEENWPGALRPELEKLRGRDLCCWCKIGDPCHADVLLEIANA
jgi:Domain of unknown function (DUF4326)